MGQLWCSLTALVTSLNVEKKQSKEWITLKTSAPHTFMRVVLKIFDMQLMIGKVCTQSDETGLVLGEYLR